MVSTADQDLTPRAQRMRAMLERIADVAAEQLGERPQVITPPDPAGLPDLPGRTIPAEARDLYSITSGGGAYHYRIVSPTHLVESNDRWDDLMTDYPLLGRGDLPWGPRPVGDALVVLESTDPVYLAELDGRPSGVTALAVGHDEGYRWIAPSLERLIETWLAITEAGLGTLSHDTAGGAHLIPRHDDRSIGKARDICHAHSCSLAAAVDGVPD